MFISPAMSLNVWNQSSDPYEHEDLANNFLKLDQHDHSPGRGIQIQTAGISDNAITNSKIAPSSITADKIAVNVVLPAGVILPYGASSPPSGFLMADGSLQSRSTYAQLFSVIGTRFGNGDNLTTFALPNTRDIFLVGAGNLYSLGENAGNATAVLQSSNLPAHSHTITAGATDPGHQHTVVMQQEGADGPWPGPFGNTSVQVFETIQSPGASGATLPYTTATGVNSWGLIAGTAYSGITGTDVSGGAASPFGTLPPLLGMYFIIKF